MGSDSPDESEDWDGRPRDNVFTNNVISDTRNGVKINSADGNNFTCESARYHRQEEQICEHFASVGYAACMYGVLESDGTG